MSKYLNAIRTLAKMKALDAENAERLLNAHVEEQDGGPGSGNFGHAGRPGKKGGSAPGKGGGGGTNASTKPKSGNIAPMGFKKGSTPSFVKKAESKKGAGPEDLVSYGYGGKTMVRPKARVVPPEEASEYYARTHKEPGNGYTFSLKYNPSADPISGEMYKKPKETKLANIPEGERKYDPKAVEKALKKWKQQAEGMSQKEFEKYWDGPTEKASRGIEAENKKRDEQLARAMSQEKPNKSNLLKGLSGKIDPKEHPEIFANGNVPYDKTQKGVESVEVVRGPNGRKLLEVKYKNGESQRMSAEEMRDLTNYMAGEPGDIMRIAPYEKRMNKEQLGIARMETADWCFNEKQKYPKDSEEYKGYETAEKVLSSPLPGRPTPAESAKMIRDNLSNISNQLRPSAVERYKLDLQNEPKITKDICDVADALGTKMIGLDHRIKGVGDKVAKDKNGNPIIDPETGKPKIVCRTQEKIMQDIAEAEANGETLAYDDCVKDINDYVRYTQACTTDNLKKNFERTVAMLKKRGYSVVKVKNFYKVDPMKNPYRGVTCVFEKDGTKFEMQFHTPQSYAAKEAQHGLYEIDRGDKGYKPSDEEHEQLQARMRAVATPEKVPLPKGIEKIESYRREEKST